MFKAVLYEYWYGRAFNEFHGFLNKKENLILSPGPFYTLLYTLATFISHILYNESVDLRTTVPNNPVNEDGAIIINISYKSFSVTYSLFAVHAKVMNQIKVSTFHIMIYLFYSENMQKTT